MRLHVALFALLAAACASVSAQDSIDARASAQLARETAAKQQPVQPSRTLESIGKVPKPAPIPERPAHFELIAIKGFAGRLEAVVGVNGRRSTATLRTPLLPDGWSLSNLGPECAEVRKAGAKPDSRTLCFIAPAPPPFNTAPTTASAAPGGALPPLPPARP